jgi:hypothetical protein
MNQGAPRSSIPYRGAVMCSPRHRGHRLGLVSRDRSRNTYPQSGQVDGSRMKRRLWSRARLFTTCIKCSSTCRSGMPSICASWWDDSSVPVIRSIIRWRGVLSGGNMMSIVGEGRPENLGVSRVFTLGHCHESGLGV